VIDLGAEIVAALTAPARAAMEEMIDAVVTRVVRRELERAQTDRYLRTSDLAAYLGIKESTLRTRLHRGSELAQIALTLDGRRCWRRTDVDSLLSRQPTLRAPR
jgi:hypothetical protein